MKILITGGGGFLGKNLAKELQLDGNKIYFLSKNRNLFSKGMGNKKNSEFYLFDEYEEIQNIIKKINPNIIIHTACSYGRNRETQAEILSVNFTYGCVLLKALSNLDELRTFINVGTSLPSDINYYAKTKNQFSDFGFSYTQPSSGSSFLNIKLEHMYGPGDSLNKFTTKIIHDCYKNKAIIDLTKGNQKRDFIYIDDVTSAFKAIVKNLEQFKESKSIDVGSGKVVSIKEFVKKVHLLTKSQSYLNFGALAYRNEELMVSCANLELLEKIGWSPRYSLVEGILKTIKKDLELEGLNH